MVIKVVKKKFVTRLDPRIKIKSQIKKIVNSLSKIQKVKYQNSDHKNLRAAEVGGMFSTDAPYICCNPRGTVHHNKVLF